MKHISFDESTVMREFARIAGEQGLVKVAQPPQPREMPPAAPPQSRTIEGPMTTGLGPAFENDMKKFPAILASVSGGKIDGSALLKELAPFMRAAKGWLGSQDAASKQKMMALGGKLTPVLRLLMKQLEMRAKKMGAMDPNIDTVREALGLLSQSASPAEDGLGVEAAKKLPCGCKAGGCVDNEDCDCAKKCPCKKEKKEDNKKEGAEDNMTVKQADGKLYDVSGETGEQLVDKAHPGGGTKTELTHSKTDENLVETIVEQQEADLEVARSVPKGTYAELKTLYTVLSKMGYSEHLGELKALMAATASTEEVLADTLTSLADSLDRLGYTKHADQVDELLKKKV